MKNGWQNRKVSEIAEHSLGKMLDKAKNKGELKPYLRNFNVRWFGFDLSDMLEMRFLPEEAAKYTAVNGDVLICEGGYPGRAAIWEQYEPIYFQKALHRVRFHEPERSKWFLYYLHAKDLDGTLKNHFNGAGIQHFTGESLAQFQVPLPPLPEQKRIVGILDEAFEGIAKAKANAEKNLQNARALFESHLQSVFNQKDFTTTSEASPSEHCQDHAPPRRPDETSFAPATGEAAHRATIGVTRTGGRAATLRKIPGRFSLAVGAPNAPARKGWRWSLLTDLARLESGHTPSRRHPEYWGGPIPWIGIQDAREWHGRTIEETIQHTNNLGIANSAARILPGNTVCLSRTASVGYVVVTGKPMSTSQDFVNWVCSDLLMPHFLKYLLLAEGRGLLRFASGSVHSTIYFPEVKAFYVCYPSRKEQARIVDELDALRSTTQRLESIYQQKLSSLEELKKSLLHEAFAGAL
jgi:restriction endonuclease S subunit